MKIQMTKPMKKMLIYVGILFGCIFGYHIFKFFMVKHFLATYQPPAVTVSVMQVRYQLWQPKITASGSVRAIKGVNVTTEIAGMVNTIYFTPGAPVTEGTVLVQLNANSDTARLHSLEANAALAKITYKRDKAQLTAKAVSQATVDSDAANLKNLEAQVSEQEANVNKKTIRAPFTGRLGISAVNPGQYVNPGDKIVNLQSLDPIYIDFFVPQQALVRLKTDQVVTITTDSFPGQKFVGKITTINPGIDPATRNVEVEATIANPDYKLTPGMFVAVEVDTGTPQRFLTLPQTAVSFNPYGDVVFIVKATGKDKKGKPILNATQSFVATGETRGDQTAILSGLKEGEMVVTSGQIKLKNGSQVVINNSVVPANNPAPVVGNE